ncbi:L10-interacting MYB domain-containing protein-like isoform X2 [Humulus lupulus]|uniref:L10-interacting MYB domain-containing protein-like isoform X2 n=1 Tax=Humulus lupulus TaxID=3486 RepID=UPI002B406BE4|nr:L10-interacting MYB domain-containing protein-like isoform X2 [Humulus lupulus]
MENGYCGNNGESLRANWTPSQDTYFISLLMEEVRKGNKTAHGFRKQSWAGMIVLFNSKFGFHYDTDVLRNRYKRFRKQYNEMKSLVNQTGFKWDDLMHMVIADDKEWSEYIKANPEMQPYRMRVVPYYNELCIICGHAVADGRYSLSCFDLDFENEAVNYTKDDPKRIDWSESMGQFFTELLLEQVHKGNKIGRVFKKKSWVCMISSFNAKFGVQYSRYVLKNRYNILRRHYSNIQTLLGQKGFNWDKAQKKVVADDVIWDHYVKEHPNFQMYRNKAMPCYTDMCAICRNEATLRKDRKDPSSCSTPIFKKEATEKKESGDPMPTMNNIGAHEKKRGQLEITPTSQPYEIEQRIDDNDVGDAFVEMAAAVSSFTKKQKEEKSVSIEHVIGVLQSIPDVDDDLLLDACDLLEDEKRARIFLALDSTLRKKWLIRKLRPQ